MNTEKKYLVEDFVGSEVATVDGEFLGILEDVILTGGNDVYVVRKGPEEILIPALKSVVLSIDIEKKKIQVRLPDGLRESQA